MSEQEPTKREIEKSSTAKEHARMALEQRSKRSSNSYYYAMVLIFFGVVLVAGTVYLVLEWQKSPNLVQAIDKENIAKHNEKKRLFKRGPNTLFAVLFTLL